MSWDSPIFYLLYALWVLVVLLTIKLLVTRSRWRHPLRGNGPMLVALLLIMVNTEVARGQTIQYANNQTPPPYWPSVVIVWIATLFIVYWLWRQLELIPAWIRRHLPWRRRNADYSWEEHVTHTESRTEGQASELTDEDREQRRREVATETKDWPPRTIERK